MAKKQSNTVIPSELVSALAKLAEEAVPIQEWITGSHKEFKPSESPLPWRPAAGSPGLKTEQLKVVEYLEQYWQQLEIAEKPLVKRLRDLQEQPSDEFFSKAWRKRRALNSDSVFGAVHSDNVPFRESDEATGEHHIVGRIEFLRGCWEPLLEAIRQYDPDHGPTGSSDWKGFMKWLHRGEFGPRLSEFVHVFAADVLRALMNQDHLLLNHPQKSALLIELGEGRRPDAERGAHTVEEVAKAVQTLERLIDAP
jgi:hypothetical protein